HLDVEGCPVRDLAGADAALFLWATAPMLPEALALMTAWEFRYKTIAFAWVKRSKTGEKLHWGMGNWTRANAEVVLLGVRGDIRRASKGVHQIVYGEPEVLE